MELCNNNLIDQGLHHVARCLNRGAELPNSSNQEYSFEIEIEDLDILACSVRRLLDPNRPETMKGMQNLPFLFTLLTLDLPLKIDRLLTCRNLSQIYLTGSPRSSYRLREMVRTATGVGECLNGNNPVFAYSYVVRIPP